MSIKINLNIFFFLLLFIVTHQIEIYSLIMLFALMHELGHLICGILLGFTAKSLKIMPLGFGIEFKINVKEYNRKILKSNSLCLKKLLISLSGPITNIIIIIIGTILGVNDNIIYANLILVIFNLIPIYPLDGGRILKNVLKLFFGNQNAYYFSNKVSNIFVITITIFSSIAIYYYKNIGILLAVLFVWYLNISENKRYKFYERIYNICNEKE